MAHRTPVVLVLIESPDKDQGASLHALIMDSITLELGSRGIRAVTSDTPAADSAGVLEQAKAAKADFAISGSYTHGADGVVLQLGWFDVEPGKEFPPASKAAALDLSFDTAVSDLVGEILEDQKERIASLPPPDPVPVAETPAVETASQRSPSPVPPVDRKISRLAFSLGAAPFIPIFKASAYIPSVGLSINGEGEYRFPVSGGLIGICAQGGVNLFQAEKGSSASVIVVPVGVGAVYRTQTGSAFDFAVTAAGGPALFMMTPAGGKTENGVVPFVMAGVELSLTLFEHIGASIQLAYVSYFVQDAIMGFNPSIALNTRF